MLKDSLIRQPTEEDPDEGVKDLVDIALKKMVLVYATLQTTFNTEHYFTIISHTHAAVVVQDYDHDGKVSYADFKTTVKDENLLLEAFGNCLPHLKVDVLWKSNLALFRRTESKL